MISKSIYIEIITKTSCKTTTTSKISNWLIYLRFRIKETAYKLQSVNEYNVLIDLNIRFFSRVYRIGIQSKVCFFHSFKPQNVCVCVCVLNTKKDYLNQICRGFFSFFFSFPNKISKHKNVSQLPTHLNRTLNRSENESQIWRGSEKKYQQQKTNDKIKLDIMWKSLLTF